MMKKILLLVAVVLVVWGVYALVNNQQAQAPAQTPSAQAPTLTYALAAGDQLPGRQVIISVALLARPAFLLVHRSVNGAPGKVIGQTTLLPAGTQQNVSIPLSEAVKAGDQLFVMAHSDDNGNGMLDYLKDVKLDIPSVDSESKVVMTMVTVK